MDHINDFILHLMTWWFQHIDLCQNEVMSLLHRALQLLPLVIPFCQVI